MSVRSFQTILDENKASGASNLIPTYAIMGGRPCWVIRDISTGKYFGYASGVAKYISLGLCEFAIELVLKRGHDAETEYWRHWPKEPVAAYKPMHQPGRSRSMTEPLPPVPQMTLENRRAALEHEFMERMAYLGKAVAAITYHP